MPRANRFHVPGLVWHITQRCHDRQFLLKFERDRARWRHWLFKASRRYQLSVLDYIVTSNHVHLLVRESKPGSIARSMQLMAARVAQEYNQRKRRRGAFWEERYFATAVATDDHLIRCLVYIDLNMVRAGVVNHPSEWGVCGFNEIQDPPKRYRVIDFELLCELTGTSNVASLRSAHRQWIEHALLQGRQERQAMWTEPVAVGSKAFVDALKTDLGMKVYHRGVGRVDEETYLIRES